MATLTTYTQESRDIPEDLSDPEGGAAQPAATVPPAPPTFAELGVDPRICEALAAKGIVRAFRIQELALPIALAGQDMIGQARTGTGKTLGFGIPLLQRLSQAAAERRPGAPRALVVVPTRELAIQVADDLSGAGSVSGARVLTVYGGRAYEPQIEALRAGVDVVVGTPGRLLDLARQRHVDLSDVRTLVLDEADKMLDLGFLPDVERILQLTPDDRQTMLFSATMPGEIVTLGRRYLKRPTHVRAEQHDEPEHPPLTTQHVFRAHQMDKVEMLARVLQAQGRGLTMVFCRTKRTADQLAEALATRGFAAAAVHGDLGQAQRERALRAFRHGKVDVLVATDVAARGLDVDDVTHVVNYECPEDEKAYLHRIGRTGRAGRTGVAVTLVDWADLARWKVISDTLGLDIAEPPETYSTSEHLYSELGIPAGATGKLPRDQRERAGLEAEEIEDLGETGGHRPPRRGERSHRGPGRGDRRGRGSLQPAGHEAASRDGEAGEARAARTRVRRRTRGGAPIEGGSPRAHDAAAAPVTSDQAAAAEAETAPAGHGRPPRRRRRGGRGRQDAAASGPQPADAS